jgi:glycerol-3-phosphate dehydrogenase (NAD(P)+)
MPKIAIIGTTAWGTTLGVMLARRGVRVKLWARNEGEDQRLNEERENATFLPGVRFPFRLNATADLKEALDKVAMVILAVPAQTMRQNIKRLSEHLDSKILIVSAAKGLEVANAKRMSEVIAEEIPAELHSHICALSGPNLSQEIAQRLPAVSVVAAHDISVAEQAQRLLNSPNFCVFTNNDLVGVELAGSLKNIIAMGAGMVDGLGLGDNAKAAFMTRGLAEITCLGIAAGANPLTFAGLAGIGDTVATCASNLSRNHYVGLELAKGRKLDDITASMQGVAEGVATTQATRLLAQRLGVEMPITEQLYRVLFEGLDPRHAVPELMGQRMGQELIDIIRHLDPQRTKRWLTNTHLPDAGS